MAKKTGMSKTAYEASPKDKAMDKAGQAAMMMRKHGGKMSTGAAKKGMGAEKRGSGGIVDTTPRAARNTAAERLATSRKAIEAAKEEPKADPTKYKSEEDDAMRMNDDSYDSPPSSGSKSAAPAKSTSSSSTASSVADTSPKATRNTAAERVATRAGSAIGTVGIVGSKVDNEYTSPKEDTSTASSSSREKSTDEGMGPSVSMTSMKINKGDTLSAIAKRHGTTVKDLMDANPYIKDANKIYAGKSLTLKKKPEVSQDGYKKGGSLRRASGGGLGVGKALRGYGAVRKK